jgi:hypothetical protein
MADLNGCCASSNLCLTGRGQYSKNPFRSVDHTRRIGSTDCLITVVEVVQCVSMSDRHDRPFLDFLVGGFE